MNTSQSCHPKVLVKTPPPCQKRHQSIKQQPKLKKSIISTIKKTTSKNPGSPEANLQLRICSSDVLCSKKYYVSPIYEETSMKVMKAECVTNSKSDNFDSKA